jgi:hypothetical protein
MSNLLDVFYGLIFLVAFYFGFGELGYQLSCCLKFCGHERGEDRDLWLDWVFGSIVSLVLLFVLTLIMVICGFIGASIRGTL